MPKKLGYERLSQVLGVCQNQAAVKSHSVGRCDDDVTDAAQRDAIVGATNHR
jgi:hypothetical protein